MEHPWDSSAVMYELFVWEVKTRTQNMGVSNFFFVRPTDERTCGRRLEK